jgi:aspartate-semialdehyde dehydrogenase
MEKITVGVIGATGMVGQQYICLLENHPWFEVVCVAASQRCAGKPYREAVDGRWHMHGDIPAAVANLTVMDASDVDAVSGRCRFVFSAVGMGKQAVRELENRYAAGGTPVVSNNSAHRTTPDVPVLIPEVNAYHLDAIATQQANHDWDGGFVVVKPNCSVQSYLIPVHALATAGYPVRSLVVTMLQGLSGAGYPGVSALDIVDNIVPFISGEEEKSESEPLKIMGAVSGRGIAPMDNLTISAHCTRVPVLDGHSACVSMGFGDPKPGLEEIERIWREFTSVPQDLKLPSAPPRPIMISTVPDRPQPRKDRLAGKGMAITVGRLRPCNVLDYRFVGLSHNTIRGAAGGGILNAELLKARGLL